MSTFKLDYSNVTSDENLNKLRQSKHMGMKNLTVSNDFAVGKIKFSEGHITSSDTKDNVIYFDGQVNIMQSAYTDDIDVIGTDKNTSFVDYRNLSKTYYTKIGGSSNEYVHKNNKCIDKDNNLYVVFESVSDVVNIYDSTNNNVPVSDLERSEEDNSSNIVIVKYNHLGEYQWSTHIGGYYDQSYPSLVCDNEGNVIVCFGNSNGGMENDVLIYDTTDNYNPASTISDAANDSAIIVKYNSNGVFLWTVHVDGIYTTDSPIFPRISCDVSGNIFLGHTLLARQLKIYDKTPEEYVPLPDDFFCVVIDHLHTGHTRFSQPIITYNTGLSSYNFVTIKFDKDGKLKWVNHVEFDNTNYLPKCFIDNDIDGNVILTGNFAYTLIKIWNPLNTALVVPDATLSVENLSYGEDNLFMIKFDPNGKVIWCTKTAAYDDDVTDANTITDSEGNIYFAFRSRDPENFLFDTTSKTTPVHVVNIKNGVRSLFLIKYNKDGQIQWYTQVDGYGSKYEPCLAIDNRYIKGSENSNIYLAGEFLDDLNFYNANNEKYVAYTLHYVDLNDYSSHGFISCFNQDGKFSWATKALISANNNVENSNVNDLVVSADKDGHVYLMGVYSEELNIYDSQNNDKPIATLSKANANDEIEQDDIFIIKYNRYGLLNTSNPKLLYIEDNSDIPDSFCKEIILTNNDNNGIVNLQILHKENHGYSVRRNVLITEAIELITKDGIWIPKIISEQYEYTNDLDVIDPNTKTSFVNYQNLQNTFYTKIGGGGDDLNPQMHLDKYDNVYMAGVFNSSELNIYDFTNNSIPVGSLLRDGDQSLFLTKYNSVGINQWYTKIEGYYTKSEPSVFVNGNGDFFVTLQSYDDNYDVRIYDVNNQQIPAKTLSVIFTEYSNTIFVKYNNKGEFQWNIRMFASNQPESPSFTSTAVVTGDLEGNLFVSGYFDGDSISVLDTGDDETPVKIFTRNNEGSGAYFICKFDYTGKFIWINHLEGEFPNNESGPSPDFFKFFRINLNTDSVGNLYLTSNFYSEVFIYNPDSTQIENIIFDENGDGLGVFTVKYNANGIYQWYTGIFTNSFALGAVETGSCVDADGNLYVSFTNVAMVSHSIFDTRVVTQPVYTYNNENENYAFVSIVKFNNNGVYQWSNFIKSNEIESSSDLVISPVITCDNQYITGQYNPNIYIHFAGNLDNYRGGFNFYNASSIDVVAYTLPSKDYWIDDNTIHTILAKYDSNGNFKWSTTSAGYIYGEGEVGQTTPSNVKVDRSGHVYISGSFFENDLQIWDVSTNGAYDNPITSLYNNGDFDCYLIKYNKYGLINNKNSHPDIYLEDVQNIPNAYEKSIIITNNVNNGPVNCQILEKLESGYSYSFRKTITLTDSLDLVSNDGKWIPKIQTEQISLSNDFDVIDINTKMSVLEFDNLNDSSWTTKIGGEGDERNPHLSCDKNNNLYTLFSFNSTTTYLYEFNGGSENINKYSTSRDVGLAKYSSKGNVEWITKIGFDSDFTGYPTLYTDAEGNSYVTLVKTDDGIENNIYIFDTRDNSVSLKSVSLTNSGVSLIKYDKDGLYLWDIRIRATFNSSDGSYGSNAVADKNGNVYLSGFILDNDGVEIWDTSNYIKDSFAQSQGMFVVKFDKSGKYIWGVPLYNGVNTTDNNISINCDNDGNVIVSANQYDTVSVYQRVGNSLRYFNDITKVSGSNISIFTVKYDTNGTCIWTTRLGVDVNGNAQSPASAIDSYGNYYLSAQVNGNNVYIFDTRNETVRYTIPIPTTSSYCTFFAKYNKNGIIQWYSFISGYSIKPSICIDNKFTQGISDNSVYLSGSYEGAVEGYINIYNSGSNGNLPYISVSASLSSATNNSYLVKFDNNGYLKWCSKVGGSDTNINCSLVATSDGHIYLAGDFNTGSINVYQGFTLNMDPNTNISTTIENYSESNTFDIFLIKYNRYGTVNSSDYRLGKEIYLENNNSIPNGTEKSIVVINNGENNGYRENVCLIILQNIFPGYRSFRNIWFSEGISLICYDGQWFVKSSSGDTLPKRSIIMWGGNQTNIPGGWRLCDGGILNGVTTPDLRGRFVLGYNNDASGVNGSSANGGNTNTGTDARTSTTLSGSVGLIGGEVLHTLTINEMPAHNHGITDEGHNHTATTYDAGSIYNDFGSNTSSAGSGTATTNTNTTGITINNTGGGANHNNIPPYYVLAYIMKCF